MSRRRLIVLSLGGTITMVPQAEGGIPGQVSGEDLKRGAVVNILSMVIHCGQSFLVPYAASVGAAHCAVLASAAAPSLPAAMTM